MSVLGNFSMIATTLFESMNNHNSSSEIKAILNNITKAEIYAYDAYHVDDTLAHLQSNVEVADEYIDKINKPIYLGMLDGPYTNSDNQVLGVLLSKEIVVSFALVHHKLNIKVVREHSDWNIDESDIIRFKDSICKFLHANRIFTINNITKNDDKYITRYNKELKKNRIPVTINDYKLVTNQLNFFNRKDKKHMALISYLDFKDFVKEQEGEKHLGCSVDDFRIFQISYKKIDEFLHSIDYDGFIDKLSNRFKTNDEFEDYIISNFTIDKFDLPFDNLFIGFSDIENYVNKANVILGYVVTKDKIFIYRRNVISDIQYLTGAANTSDVSKDYQVKSLIFVRLIGMYINSFKSIKVDKLSDRSISHVTSRNKTVNTRSDYYTISLKPSTTYNARNVLRGIRRSCEYAFDVKGHRVYRISKGSMPIDTKTEAYLKKDERRKIFYDRNEIDDESLDLLHCKGIEVDDNEWVSILEIYRKGHISNSKGGLNPYIRSIHTE